MERMIESYLEFASDIASVGEPEVFDIADLLREVAEDADQNGSRISVKDAHILKFEGRRAALKRALSNLVGNGLKYAGHVALSAARKGPYVEIFVDDDGPGIPEDKRREVFKPFTRLDEARGGAAGGVGLGLTVVREIVRSHGGEVTLGPSPEGGLRAHVKLPG
jgi:two-component system osmolarity sensor histidine kinase EnvZ